MGHAVDTSLLSLVQIEVKGVIRDLTLQSSQLSQVQGTVSALQEQLSSEIARSKEQDARFDSVEEERKEDMETRRKEIDQILGRLAKTDDKVEHLQGKVGQLEREVKSQRMKDVNQG